MRTTKSISNISYQTPAFFAQTLKGLQSVGVIGACYWILHKGEEGDKDHIHFVLLGGQKTYNTEGLEKLFGIEVVGDNPQSVTKQWRVTKDIRDWLCYCVHNTTYLLRKGEVRDIAYDWADFKCGEGDEDTLRLDIIEAKRFVETGGDKIYRALNVLSRQGKSWSEVIRSGLIPVNCLGGAFVVWKELERVKSRAMMGGGDSEAVTGSGSN